MQQCKTFFEFTEEYKMHGFIDKVSSRYYPSRRLNQKQIQRYYLQYVKKWDRANCCHDVDKINEPSDDSKLSALVRERDKGCRLLRVLNFSEYAEWSKNHNGIGKILDAAHIFGKNAFPRMRFEERNVVLLNRFSHSCLDTGKSPVNGRQITDKERKEWWHKIAGDDWEYLNILSRRV